MEDIVLCLNAIFRQGHACTRFRHVIIARLASAAHQLT